MKKKFIIKNLMNFFIPMLIPLLLLGSLSTFIIQKFVKEELNKSSLQVLNLASENFDMVFSELDSISLNFDNNPDITNRLKSVLGNPKVSLEDYAPLTIIESLLTSSGSTKSFVHSIYIYYDDFPDKIMTNNEGVTLRKLFLDNGWYNDYKSMDPSVNTWIAQREFTQYPSQSPPKKVITIFKRLSVMKGVIVMNIRPDYMDKLVSSLKLYPDQDFYILNADKEVFYKSSSSSNVNLKALDVERLTSAASATAAKKGFVISSLRSDRYNWVYLSVIPQATLYRIPSSLSTLTLFLFIMSLILGLSLAYSLTRKNYSYVYNIITIIDSAECGKPLPSYPDRIKDEYGYIIHNILKTFIEQSYLKIQLSEREYKMQTLELLALQSQINPHFLFNTLNAIYLEALNLTEEPNKVNEMLEYLTDILEYSLTSPKEVVRLDEEIKYTKSYIKIQKIRYGEKFKVKWDYDENFCDVDVMKLIFQPLIENSVYHGIRGKKGGCGIKIKIYRKQQYLYITVIDNGLGISPERLVEIRNKLSSDNDFSEHIGLYNTNKRLKIAYKDEYCLKLRSKLNWGTSVQIRLPIQV